MKIKQLLEKVSTGMVAFYPNIDVDSLPEDNLIRWAIEHSIVWTIDVDSATTSFADSVNTIPIKYRKPFAIVIFNYTYMDEFYTIYFFNSANINNWSTKKYWKDINDWFKGKFDDNLFLIKGKANGVASLDANGNVPIAQLGNIDNNLYIVVETLPTTDIKENKIYIVKDSTSTATDNKYIEYIYINSAWEKIGEFSAAPDLTNYAKVNTNNTFTGANTFTGINTFNANINVKQDKIFVVGTIPPSAANTPTTVIRNNSIEFYKGGTDDPIIVYNLNGISTTKGDDTIVWNTMGTTTDLSAYAKLDTDNIFSGTTSFKETTQISDNWQVESTDIKAGDVLIGTHLVAEDPADDDASSKKGRHSTIDITNASVANTLYMINDDGTKEVNGISVAGLFNDELGFVTATFNTDGTERKYSALHDEILGFVDNTDSDVIKMTDYANSTIKLYEDDTSKPSKTITLNNVVQTDSANEFTNANIFTNDISIKYNGTTYKLDIDKAIELGIFKA